MDELLVRHAKERRDLQSRITQKKKSATKKTRKGINDECDRLERDLKERHAEEIAGLNDQSEGSGGDGDAVENTEQSIQELQVGNARTDQIDYRADRISNPDLSNLSSPIAPSGVTASSSTASASVDTPGRGPKRNRQKERLARRAAELEAVAAEAAKEAELQPDLREQERREMKEAFRERGLREVLIRPDGHCLYSAFADQVGYLHLQPRQRPSSEAIEMGGPLNYTGEDAYKVIRRQAGDYIASHPDDFIPFLEEPLSEYVFKVRDTAEWGGQVELLALSRSYGVNINVVQGSGRVERIVGDDGDSSVDGNREIWLAYSRHSFGLGEHYNSLRKV